jgi:transglutaminase-like putative cysteine protease
MSAVPTRRRHSLVASAEVALAAITIVAVLGMSRLFLGREWLAPLLVNAIAAHAVVTACRRRGFSLPTTALLMVLGAAVVSTWTCYWSTTTVGIPTGATWSAMHTDLSEAWRLYQDVKAPAPVETGFVLASAVALWCIAYVADWAAFRLWVPFEATLPAGTLFLFTALLGTTRGRGWAVGLYAAALLGFLLLHRMARQDGTSHWVAERTVQGHRSLLTAGAALGVVAVMTGTIFGPSLPGADSPGVLDPRSLRDRDSSRVTISPLVDIQRRLVDQRDLEVFTVRSPEPAYWRLTSLERFDGNIWRSSGSYGKADGDLPEAVPITVESQTFDQTFSISALATLWLPSAYEPRAIDPGDVGVLYDDDSATLLVDKGTDSSDGMEYTVTSASPRITAADLEGSAGEIPGSIRDTYLDLPDDLSPRVRDLAAQITADADTPYAAARALQDHLRTFTYDLTVPKGHSDDVLVEFLFDTQRGYCEQFAGAFAAMARAVGLPARVAVGFTSGQVDPADPTLYHVRGEHAHAWPEVYLAGAGWVSFEPTPGRGMPFAEDYTGVQPAQAAPGQPGGSEVAPPTTRPAPSATIPSTDQNPRAPRDEVDTNAGSGSSAGSDSPSAPVRFVVRPAARAAPVVGIALLAYLVLFPLALWIRLRLRRRRATTPAERIALAWAEATEVAALVGYREVRSDTFAERAERLAGALPDTTVPADARVLARQLEEATYSATGADELGAELAEEAALAVGEAALAASRRRDRVRRWLDPRPHVRSWRRDRAGRQRRITTTVRGDLEAERQLVGTSDR